MNKKKMLEDYAAGAGQISDLSGKIPEAMLDYIPLLPDAWSIRQHLIHLVDSDINNFIRIKSCLAQPFSDCYVIQEEDWVKNLGNAREDVAKYVRVFALLRQILFELLENIPERQFSERYYVREYQNEKNNITLSEALEMYTNHVQIHIDYIERNIAEYNKDK